MVSALTYSKNSSNMIDFVRFDRRRHAISRETDCQRENATRTWVVKQMEEIDAHGCVHYDVNTEIASDDE